MLYYLVNRNDRIPLQTVFLTCTNRVFMCIVLGDPRSNQNPALLSFGILLFKWHNVIADRVQQDHPDWSDEEVFQKARRFVVATLQVCTIHVRRTSIIICKRMIILLPCRWTFIVLYIICFHFSEYHCLRIHTRILGNRTSRVYGLQARCTPRYQPCVPIVGLPIWTHDDPSWYISEGRKMQLSENSYGESGSETVRLLVGFQCKYLYYIPTYNILPTQRVKTTILSKL